MFNAKLLELNENDARNYFNYDMDNPSINNPHDSFSSGSEPEDSHRLVQKSSRNRKRNPHRAIPQEFALTNDEKAKAGIFVVDPFHYRVTVQFLRAFAEHHHINSMPTDEFKESTKYASDMSHMGFNTGSSSEDEHRHHDWERESIDGHQKQKLSRKSRTVGVAPNKKIRRSSLTTLNSSSYPLIVSSNSNKIKIVNSSSLPRPADNSDKFSVNLSPEMISKLAIKVINNYKTFPLNHRHGSTPMDISSCPGVNLLTEDEYITCSLLRIRPALYFHARNTLLHNYHHSVGYFRKSAAQKMLRIDVNKTGKLYDFIVRQRWMPDVEGGPCQAEPDQIIVDDPDTYHQL